VPAAVGDIVTVMTDCRDWADKLNTIPWEILCGFKHRLPRLICPSNKNFAPPVLTIRQ